MGELMEDARARVTAAWPAAVWMPWDAPPIGTVLCLLPDLDGRSRSARVLGRSAALPEWWEMEWLDVWASPAPALGLSSFRFVAVGSPDAGPVVSLAYPPSLSRAA